MHNFHHRYSNHILYLRKNGDFSIFKWSLKFYSIEYASPFQGNRRQLVMTGLRRSARRPFTVGLRGDNGVLTNNIPCRAPEN